MLNTELRDRLIALAVIAIIVWVATLASYCGRSPLSPVSDAAYGGHAEEPADETIEENPPPFSWAWFTGDAITVYTAFLAVFSGGLLCVGYLQLRLLRRADRGMSRAAVTARRAANAALAQAKAARDAIRPWVFTHPWPAKSKIVGEEIHFPMFLRCYGGEPATVIRIGVYCDKAAPTKDTPIEIVTDLRGTNIGLAPDNHCFFPENPDQAGADLYKTAMGRPFIFGYIQYRDQFETTHTSRFTVKLGITDDGKVSMETVGDPVWSRFDESSKQK